MIQGIPVVLISKTETGEVDGFNRPIVTEIRETVENVLVAPVSTSEIVDTENLTGRKAVYQLGIPKGDTHTWENSFVEFFGNLWRVFGLPHRGIPDLIPGEWNDIYYVERYGHE